MQSRTLQRPGALERRDFRRLGQAGPSQEPIRPNRDEAATFAEKMPETAVPRRTR